VGQEDQIQNAARFHASLPGEHGPLAKRPRTASSCIACLPVARRRATDEVMDSSQSIIFDQSENVCTGKRLVDVVRLSTPQVPSAELRAFTQAGFNRSSTLARNLLRNVSDTDSTPQQDGFRMPGEYSRTQVVGCCGPSDLITGDSAANRSTRFCSVAAAIAQSER